MNKKTPLYKVFYKSQFYGGSFRGGQAWPGSPCPTAFGRRQAKARKPANRGFADLCLTIPHHSLRSCAGHAWLFDYNIYMEVTAGIEPANRGFADLCLTTWLRDLNRIGFYKVSKSYQKNAGHSRNSRIH